MLLISYSRIYSIFQNEVRNFQLFPNAINVQCKKVFPPLSRSVAHANENETGYRTRLPTL